jgi:hypothetical protein
MTERLKYAQTVLNNNDDTLVDILNGCKVQELRKRGWFNTSTDFGLVAGADGGTIFKRSGFQAWPVWGFIANLSPEERYEVICKKKKNLVNIIVGLKKAIYCSWGCGLGE